MLADCEKARRPMPLILKFGAALLGAALAVGGSVAAGATADPGDSASQQEGAGPDAMVAAADGTPTRMAIVGSITVPPADAGLLPAELLEEYTSPTGELTRQLNSLSGRPVAIGVDPMIVASIRILGTNAPASATAWLQRLATTGNETFALGYADADIAALSQAGLASIPGPLSFAIDSTLFPEETTAPTDENGTTDGEPGSSEAPASTSPSPSPPTTSTVPTQETLSDLPWSLDSIVWPRNGDIVAADLAVFNSEGPVTTLVDSESVAFPSGAPRASATSAGSSLLVSDSPASAQLQLATSSTSDESWASAMASLTASLAGWPDSSSTMLLTLDRSIPLGVNRLALTLDALAQDPGVTTTTLAAARGEASVEVAVVDHPVAAERTSQLATMFATEPGLAQFATVLADPALITGERRLALLALSSNSWADLTAGWTPAVNSYLSRSAEFLESVKVEESSTLNLRSYTGNLPITVSNSLPFPVTVAVHVAADTAILDVIESPVSVVVEAGSQARALVPVRSIANGDVMLRVNLTSGTGVAISNPVIITTNVQAEWETAFTAVFVALLVIVFAVGIVRTVTRRRRERRERLAAESAPDAAADTVDAEGHAP